MAIPQHIQATIDSLERRIAKLSKLKEGLAEEFGEEPIRSSRKGTGKTTNLFAALEVPHHGTKPLTSKQRVLEFLDSQGPKFRREIIKEAGIPEGTIAGILVDKKLFVRRDDGRWELRKTKEKEKAATSVVA